MSCNGVGQVHLDHPSASSADLYDQAFLIHRLHVSAFFCGQEISVHMQTNAELLDVLEALKLCNCVRMGLYAQ